MTQFGDGQPRNTRGRPKGAKGKLAGEVQALARQLLNRRYWELTRDRLYAGTLHPRIEALLLAYAYGAPPTQRDGNAIQGGLTINLGFIAAPDDVRALVPLTLEPATDTTPTNN